MSNNRLCPLSKLSDGQLDEKAIKFINLHMCKFKRKIQLKSPKITQNDPEMTLNDFQMTLIPRTTVPPPESFEMLQKLSNIWVSNSDCTLFIE